jgi:hypothetical protein
MRERESKPHIRAYKGIWMCERWIGKQKLVGMSDTPRRAFLEAHPSVLPPLPQGWA